MSLLIFFLVFQVVSGLCQETTTELDVTEFTENFNESVTDKSISEDAKEQLLEPSVVWNGPVVKTQSIKTKANWTTKVLNGEKFKH